MEIKQEKVEIITIDTVDEILSLYPEEDDTRREKIRKDVESDIEDAKKGNRIIFGVRVDKDVVGTIQIVFSQEDKRFADGKEKAHLHHARVAEGMRGRGIGSSLVRRAEEEARKRGFAEITLGVDETNEGAVRLYQRLGYHEFLKKKGREGEPIIGMKKEL